MSELPTEFVTADGLTLAARAFGTDTARSTTGVVFAHMRGRDQTTWRDTAVAVAAAGHRALTFDFRGYGGSPGTRDTGLDIDLRAAIAHLRTLGADRIMVVGASMGATASIVVANTEDLAGVVSVSAPGAFGGLDAAAVVAEVAEPVLFVAAERDQPYADTAATMAQRHPRSTLLELAGRQHGTNLFGEHGEQLTAAIVDFVS